MQKAVKSMRKAEKRGPNRGTYYAVKVCPVCEEEFEAYGWAGKQKVYCSRACYGKVRKRAREGVEVNALSATDAAYVAGFLDGEGSIMILKRENGSAALRISFSNTHRPTLEHIRELCGFGTVHSAPRYSSKHKAAHMFVLHHDGAASLLRQTVEYMVTKREQAELALAFADKKKDIAYRQDKEDQARYHERMRMLNQRGNPEEAEAS